MKTTKGELKSILKECIKELIAEGAFPGVGVSTQGTSNPTTQTVNPQMANIAQIMARNASGGDAKQAKILESVFMDAAMSSDPSITSQHQQQTLLLEKQELQTLSKNAFSRWAELAYNSQPTHLPSLPI